MQQISTEYKPAFGKGRPSVENQSQESKDRAAIRKEAKLQLLRDILLDELIWPAVSQAMKADPGYWKTDYLTLSISKTDIVNAYGKEGLEEWCSWFTLKKIGGKNRFGEGYKTQWVFNLNKYALLLKRDKLTGFNSKNTPDVIFPPQALLDRLEKERVRKEDKMKAKIKRLKGKQK